MICAVQWVTICAVPWKLWPIDSDTTRKDNPIRGRCCIAALGLAEVNARLHVALVKDFSTLSILDELFPLIPPRRELLAHAPSFLDELFH